MKKNKIANIVSEFAYCRYLFIFNKQAIKKSIFQNYKHFPVK